MYAQPSTDGYRLCAEATSSRTWKQLQICVGFRLGSCIDTSSATIIALEGRADPLFGGCPRLRPLPLVRDHDTSPPPAAHAVVWCFLKPLPFPCEVSFDRSAGQEQPSLLDYSKEHLGGPLLGAGSYLPGGERSGGATGHAGEAPLEAQGAGGGLGGGAPRFREGHPSGIDGDGERMSMTTVESETGGITRSDEERGQETHVYTSHVGAPASHQPTDTHTDTGTDPDPDPDGARSTTAADNNDGVGLLNSSEARYGTSEALQSVAEPRKRRQGGLGGTGCGGGDMVGGSRGGSLLDGVAAKVKTRHSPRRKLPAYLSASPDGLGAASRWGALSKAHLEFHRLGTAGECRELHRVGSQVCQ